MIFFTDTMRARKMIADPDFNIHAVAAVLKLFFRELPEPLFTNALHDKFLSINGKFCLNNNFFINNIIIKI